MLPLDRESTIGSRARPRTGPSFALVSTFPPTACGIASFSAALSSGLASCGAAVGVVRVAGGDPPGDHRVVGCLDEDGRLSVGADRALGNADVVILQHEYGLYSGTDGVDVVELLKGLRQPSIVVAHTVLRDPTSNQRAVLEAVVDAADVVVVMTEAGQVRLGAGFDVDPSKIVVIAHGAAVLRTEPRGVLVPPAGLLTWGLLGPGKGIEWAIDALASLGDLDPPVTYCVAGDTHPKVAATQGEAYREMLVDRAVRAGVAGRVRFDAGYRGLDDLADLIAQAAVVVLPYDSPDQVTSGVLVDAVAAGRPVVSTAFPHAVELLASGAGLVVPQRDPVALGLALRDVLTTPGRLDQMAAEARRIAPSLAWPAVAARYVALGDRLLARRAAAIA